MVILYIIIIFQEVSSPESVTSVGELFQQNPKSLHHRRRDIEGVNVLQWKRITLSKHTICGDRDEKTKSHI